MGSQICPELCPTRVTEPESYLGPICLQGLSSLGHSQAEGPEQDGEWPRLNAKEASIPSRLVPEDQNPALVFPGPMLGSQ